MRIEEDTEMEPSPSPSSEVIVSFSLPVEEERKLLARATEKGKDVSTYLRTLVEEDLKQLPRLSEVLAPIREDFRQSGMTEEELEALLKSELAEVRKNRKAAQDEAP